MTNSNINHLFNYIHRSKMEKRQRTSSSEYGHDSLSTESPGIKEKKRSDPDEINEEVNSLSWEIS